MSKFRFGKRSLRNLVGVDPILKMCAIEAIKISNKDFGVFEGIRTVKRQRMLLRLGRTTTMRSKHITGNAIDLVPYRNGKYDWSADDYFDEIERCMKLVIHQHKLPIKWGGDWRTFIDKPHWEISRHFKDGYDYRRDVYGK
jgi:peptidoglycan L-alanyl-D-glutamate endopeptidase CwlK